MIDCICIIVLLVIDILAIFAGYNILKIYGVIK